jgi:CheY-like chemotaxis protein
MPRVLIVDDDAALTRLLRLTLREGGFDVAAAGNGLEGLERVEEREPDVIVLDMQMPVMDGRKFYEELRSRGVDTPVLVLSAYNARAEQRDIHANAYMNKPFDPDELVSAVNDLVSSRQ